MRELHACGEPVGCVVRDPGRVDFREEIVAVKFHHAFASYFTAASEGAKRTQSRREQ